jgi:hypothetical protein
VTDEIDVLRRLRPSADEPHPALVAEERDRLMVLIARERTKGRRRHRSLVAALVVASAATAAAGWAVLRPDPETTTSMACGDSIIPSATGDPVADCAAVWRRENGTEPPPLVAYLGPGGGVHVLPAGEEPPAGYTPLEPAFRQDASLIELAAELADVSRGLPSRCFSEAEARTVVHAQLRRLGLSGWTVVNRPVDGAAVRGTCPPPSYTTAIVHPERQQVELVAGLGGPPPEGLPVVELARRLTRQVVEGPDARCLSVDEAADLARREAVGLGLSEAQREVVFHVVPPTDPDQPACARVTTVVGGTAEVTIRSAAR